jgi:hypothetical protein
MPEIGERALRSVAVSAWRGSHPVAVTSEQRRDSAGLSGIAQAVTRTGIHARHTSLPAVALSAGQFHLPAATSEMARREAEFSRHSIVIMVPERRAGKRCY